MKRWRWACLGLTLILIAGCVYMANYMAPTSTTSYTVNGVTFEMVRVEGGTFRMGSDDEEAYDDERVRVYVQLPDYYIGQTEVTQELWEAVMGENPSGFEGADCPVECVSWEDCQDFIAKLNVLTDMHFRLPTEAEWEYAARGGKHSKGFRYSGGERLDGVACFQNNSENRTAPVASKAPNELGIYDMSGNVWELTSERWCADYGSPRSGGRIVVRGGGWFNEPKFCRSTYRDSSRPSYRYNYLGLRLAL
jgi:formylglycine-generating enzyme required for sulfatase activity